jgi:hypothetical protein
MTKVEEKPFKEMIVEYGKAFLLFINEIGYVDPQEVTPMVIFTVLHVPWELKPIPMPPALMPKLVELLKEKLEARILERSNAPYSNRCVHPLTVCTGGLLTQSGCRLQGLVLGKMAQ